MQVQDIYIYPIKSCAGVRVDIAELTATGLEHDREFVVTRPDGTFVTQRQLPRMALIEPDIDGERLTLNAPGMDELRIVKNTQECVHPVTVWRDTVLAADQGDAVAEWLTAYLGEPLRLFGMCAETHRPIDPNFAQHPDDVVNFADGYATLLISQGSLDALNEKLDEAIGMERFRPNFVVSGVEPHAEDKWQTLQIGDLKFSGVKPCGRCAIITIDQQTGVMGKEPSRTLATYRRFPRGIMFGMSLVHHATGRISTGDGVQVLAEHPAGWMHSEYYSGQ